MSTETPILELEQVAKRFGGVPAVSGVSLAVARGEIIALLGPSGCGKTTTLRMIAGFVEPDEGTVRIAGRDMRGVRPYERNVGLVFQDYALFPHLTVAQNVAYGLIQRGLPKPEIARRVAEMLDLVQLRGFEERRPAALSGGQQQRVALARAIAITPALMLLDEPLSALDAKLRQELRFELKRILRAADCTALVVTHDQEEAMSLADHVVVMHRGRILQRGSPAAIYGAPNSRRVADFIGRANWFEGRLELANGAGCAFLAAEGRFAVAERPADAAVSYHLCVRPERLVILRDESAAGEANMIEGRLTAVAHLGAEIHYVVETPSGRPLLVVEQNRDQPLPEPGSNLRVSFRAADGILMPLDPEP